MVAPFPPARGALRDRHERWVGCDGRVGDAKTSGANADGEIVWSWPPDAEVKSCGLAMSAFGPTRRAGRRGLSSPEPRGDHV